MEILVSQFRFENLEFIKKELRPLIQMRLIQGIGYRSKKRQCLSWVRVTKRINLRKQRIMAAKRFIRR